MVLSNVLVLATGTDIQEKADGKTSPVDVYTLEVAPEDAEKLSLAAAEGKLQFALRNATDIAVDVESRDEIGALAVSFNQMASELKARDEELDATHTQLIQSEKLAAFGQLGAGIAHEVKNPLAGISGVVQVLARRVARDDPQREVYDELLYQIERLDKTVNDLLNYARPRSPLYRTVKVSDVMTGIADLVTVFPGALVAAAALLVRLLHLAASASGPVCS